MQDRGAGSSPPLVQPPVLGASTNLTFPCRLEELQHSDLLLSKYMKVIRASGVRGCPLHSETYNVCLSQPLCVSGPDLKPPGLRAFAMASSSDIASAAEQELKEKTTAAELADINTRKVGVPMSG